MCHVFSPSHAVLSAILRDEYLTSVFRTKEGDKAGSKQPQGHDPVQFKLELTPNYLISYLENTKISQKKRSWGYKTSFLNQTKGIWGAHVDSNPPISVSRPNKHPCGSGLWFELPMVAIHWLVDLNRRAYLKCLWLRFLYRSCWESWSCSFRIAFLEKFWKDWALIRMGHGYISSGSGAGIFKVRN